jgi:hypothetical protein
MLSGLGGTMQKRIWQLCCAALSAVWLGGCAFNIISVRQSPARYEAVAAGGGWSLVTAVRVGLPEGKSSPLKTQSVWHQVGRIEQGDVFHTTDQNVWVVASHQHEADIVVRDGRIVGFFLVYERTFAPADKPVDIKTASR